MIQAVQFKGKVFRIGKYRIGIWWNLIDVSNGMTGRVYLFPWHPMRRKLKKGQS